VRFVLVKNMSVAAVAVLAPRGHEVLRVRNNVALGAPDAAVADLVDWERVVLLTFDLDFHALLSRRLAGNCLRWRHAGRVLMTCNERRAPECLTAAVHFIEAEDSHNIREVSHSWVLVDVGGDVIRVER
jgi:predicted nuclease of predicted toxin-antitoxin system